MLGLALESSTSLGSVALLSGWQVMEEVRVPIRGQHEERMTPAIAALLDRAGVRPGDLAVIMCGAGPGSFTSLRVSAAIAKGLAHGLRIPLLVASSLLLVPAGAEPSLPPGLYSAVVDAMRGEVFGLDFSVRADGSIVPGEGTWLAPIEDVRARTAVSGRVLVGPSELMKLEPAARGFARLWRYGLLRKVEVGAWEPDYGRKAEAQVRWEAAHGRPLT
ncbi:MAG TPA: tRNA (adenosine(37)-N6)-threonylcarbamoyltransferase complex dimerization subunit type 1 TsaB [Gemmatimonadaceae bacterium]|nr:tRNA (adenosine(37)-N6)-threonylcarbamoyltransferase complex dimerization subunit type 1 TsaB [Gemmatimonadaceae bacterium]